MAGIGPKLLLCFHGYGESGRSFAFLEKALGNDFTLIAPDFPFHGKTIWNEGLNFDPADMLSIADRIIQSIARQNAPLLLLGFSLGGRVALHFVELVPQRIEKIILLAPDGFRVNFWYWLATQNYFGRLLFRFTMRHPSWLFLLIRSGSKTRLINQSILKFTNHYLHDCQAREDLYNRWITMRSFKPSVNKLKRLIAEHHIRVKLLYGKYDQIIRYENTRHFVRGIESQCEVSITKAGHEILKEKNSGEIIRLIKN